MSEDYQRHQTSQGVITRTRQDLINSGELFRMNEQLAKETPGAQDRRSSHSSLSSRTHDRRYHNHHHHLHQHKGPLLECCFLFANLTLVVATVIATVILIRFFQDDPLADYYEYLLSLRFYWQLIFVICLMPFCLIVAIFNVLNRLLFSASNHRPNRQNVETKQKSFSSSTTSTTTNSSSSSSALSGSSSSTLSSDKANNTQLVILKMKLFYQALLLLLVFVTLVFVAAYVKSTNLHSQIELELRKFMRNRYESEFAYRLLDDIQERYQCCDHMWYRANLKDQLPLSCFVPQTNFSVFFDRTCSDQLTSIIGVRCYMLAACLVVILISLACLFSVDLNELMARRSSRSTSRGHYEVNLNSSGLGATAATAVSAAKASDEFARVRPPDSTTSNNYGRDVGAPIQAARQDRYALEEDLEADGDLPLLQKERQSRATSTRPRHLSEQAQPADGDTDPDPVVLTRANYQMVRRERSQSPVFVAANQSAPSAAKADLTRGSTESVERLSRAPIKSALKKTASSSPTNIDELDGPLPSATDQATDKFPSIINNNNNLADSFDDEEEDEDEYRGRLRQSDSLLRQKQLQREQQLRRSLLSVRFADD